MRLLQKQISGFQQKISQWYQVNKRDLPWRKNRDPYAILVSEIMLQQTQVSRVIPKYTLWMNTYPTVDALAKADFSEILRVWSGLGYNRRALYLYKTAKIICKDFNGNVPGDVNVLMKLPGLGKYTSRAVACFAFDAQIAVVDTNIRKVIITEFYGASSVMKRNSLRLKDGAISISEKEIQDTADILLPPGKAYEWNQALMDYSSAMLKKEKIFIPKQSKFLGSDRYYRGCIIKILLKNKIITFKELFRLLNASGEDALDRYRLQTILLNLEKDKLIVHNPINIYSLSR